MKKKAYIDTLGNIIIGLIIIIIVIPLLSIPTDKNTPYLIIFIIVLLNILWVYFGSYYKLENEYILCVMGLFRRKIYYKDIKKIDLVCNNKLSFSLAKERIEIIRYKEDTLMGATYISPVFREIFYNEFKTKCNNLYKEELEEERSIFDE